MKADRLLLDTTVQLWRIVYDATETERFTKELADKAAIYTTSLVFREFLRTIIADIEYLHGQTRDTLSPDIDGRLGLSRLSQFLGIAPGNYSPRSIQRLHLVVGKVLEGFPHTKVPKSKILVRLERTANRWIRDFFRYSDEAGKARDVVCLTALEDDLDYPGRMQQARPFPPAPGFPPKAASFLEERRDQVERVEAEMEKTTQKQGKDAKLLKFLKQLRKKSKDGELDFIRWLPTYKEDCWRLGDLLITLECPEEMAVYSTDRAFTILTRATGRQLYQGYRSPK